MWIQQEQLQVQIQTSWQILASGKPKQGSGKPNSLWELNSTYAILHNTVNPAGSTNHCAIFVNNGQTTHLPIPVQTLHSVQQQ